ncbi:hypothetical protein [Streptomyces sp. NPDC001675]
MLPSVPEFPVLYYGILRAGADEPTAAAPRNLWRIDIDWPVSVRL